MELYKLKTTETLDILRLKLRTVSGRPVYLTALEQGQGPNSLFKFPGTKEYVPAKRIQLFLSNLTSRGICVARDGDNILFNLTPAHILRFIIPFKQGDDTKEAREWFKAVGLQQDVNDTSIRCKLDEAPEDLRPYIYERKEKYSGSQPTVMVSTLKCYMSTPIEAPNVTQKRWFTDATAASELYGKYTTLCPPGQYQGEPHKYSTPFNHLALVDCDPGPCTVCHGSTAERKHFCVLEQERGERYPVNHVCGACFWDSASQWVRLLEDWTP